MNMNSFLKYFFLFCSLMSLLLGIKLLSDSDISLFLWNFESLMGSDLNFNLIFDKMSLFFAGTVFFISCNVISFSSSYMNSEKENNRFLLLMVLFIFSMIMMIFFPNLIFLLLGWDGLGLVSFLLVIHYPSSKSLSAGYITVLTNRIGDIMILISIPMMFMNMNWNSSILLEVDWVFFFFILLAGMTKSAQIPFSSWLPAAMAAPTPISALVHSSTLVTAGVFLLIRFYPIISKSFYFNFLLMLTSSFTMLMAGLMACFESDMKKIIALSTLSQLGVMMFSLSLGMVNLTFFHLLTHATFKALLFMGAGNMILNISHSQDSRHFGGLMKYFPLTMCSMLLSNLSLIGFPFLAGFYSKDLIIEMSLFNSMNLLSYIILMMATLFTMVYSLRLTISIWSNEKTFSPMMSFCIKDKNISFSIAMMSVYVILSGSFLNWMVCLEFSHPIMPEVMKVLIMGFMSMMFMFYLDYTKLKFNKNLLSLKFMNLVNSMFFLTPVSGKFFMKTFISSGMIIYKNVDSSLMEVYVGKGLVDMLNIFMTKFINYQMFFVSTNLMLLLISMFLIM